MKANANKRKIFDAVDLLTEDTSAQTTEVKTEKGIEQIAIDSIKAFHAKRLYEEAKEHFFDVPVANDIRKFIAGYLGKGGDA